MMQEHMNVEECSALGSTPFMLIVSFPYMLLFFVTSALFSLHFNTNAMFFGVFVVDSIFEHILLYDCDKKYNNNINADTNSNNNDNNNNNIHP